jgi:hypothetical protein
MQKEGITWLYSVVPKMFRPSKPVYLASLNKVRNKEESTNNEVIHVLFMDVS